MNQRLASFFTPLQYLFFLCVVAGPPAATAEDLTTSSGAQLFKHYCASCHGKTAQGDGPVAPFFKLAPPDLTQMSRRSGGTFPADRARRIIDGRDSPAPHGSREMPVWGMLFAMNADQSADARGATDAAITRLVEYLRTIQTR